MHIEAFLTLIWMDFSGVRFEGGGGGGEKVVSLFKIMVWELC